MEGQSPLPGSGHGPLQQAVAAHRRVIARQSEQAHKIAGGAGPHGKHHVTHMDIRHQGPGRAHPYQVLTAVKVDQLIGIDADGGTPHPGAHDRYRPALIGSRVSKHVPGPVKLLHILQEMLRDILCPQGVSRKQDCLGYFSFFSPDMGRGCIR